MVAVMAEVLESDAPPRIESESKGFDGCLSVMTAAGD